MTDTNEIPTVRAERDDFRPRLVPHAATFDEQGTNEEPTEDETSE